MAAPQQRNILFGGDGKCLDLGPFGLCGDDIRPPPPPPHNKIAMNGQLRNLVERPFDFNLMSFDPYSTFAFID